MTLLNILDHQILEQVRLPHTGLSDEVHVTASIISLDAEGSFLIPEIGFREESDFTVRHRGKRIRV